jgi:hypothetical protein
MVTSWQHIREINAAPNHILSLHAVAKDVRSSLSNELFPNQLYLR